MDRIHRTGLLAATIAALLLGGSIGPIPVQAQSTGVSTTDGASTTSAVSPRKSGTANAPKKKRRARRRRASTLHLPAVTKNGIPRLSVKAAYVIDAASNRVLFQKNPERVLPIASLTKLVTALVLLDTHPDWDRVIEMIPDDVRKSSRTKIRSREEITVRDLFHAALMSSDNAATKALTRTSGLSPDEFADRMNEKARSLGLVETHFVEPTGLSERNVATAQDCAKILNAAKESPIINAIIQKQYYDFRSNRLPHRLVNTNRLLKSRWEVTGGKTGYISEAGYCLVTSVKAPSGSEITAVVLGAPSNAMRFAEARRILDWTFRFGLPSSEPSAGGD